jgi:hypothetical protein
MAGQNECGHHSRRSIDIGFYSGRRDINLDSNSWRSANERALYRLINDTAKGATAMITRIRAS